jgi:hypothetical protein
MTQDDARCARAIRRIDLIGAASSNILRQQSASIRTDVMIVTTGFLRVDGSNEWKAEASISRL